MEQYDYETEHSLRIASDANSSIVTDSEPGDASMSQSDIVNSSASSSTSKQTTRGKGETEAPYPHLSGG